ncbi:MAG: PilZ domain-containing protein [candidate division Zixibacteria bacterium]|nr:PilZ domain-containing protein [candidate division Zixibacteria bacterium]MDH3937077.1 PilZ domain-containing protein [candidate division Zixibacteria bacterium]MDH4033621.1 PilZ domain-containing protein [candidate division Zixibacteria bacterium]
MSETRKYPRYETEDLLMVFNRETDEHIGGLANLTPEGAMIITREPVEISTTAKCRVELPRVILDCDEFVFDAECVWCKKDTTRGWYESGYRLRNISEQDQDLLTYVMLQLMSEQKVAHNTP